MAVDAAVPPFPCRMGALARLVLRTLTYSYSARDTSINAAILSSQIIVLAIASSHGELSLGSFFWLPAGFFVLELQLITCILTSEHGFSLLWCALCGLMIYEHVVHDIFASSVDHPAATLSLVSYSLTAAGLVYYATEEVWVACQQNRKTGRRIAQSHQINSTQRCTNCWWRWCGSTTVHVLAIGLGAALVALVDIENERKVGFWTLVASILVLLIGIPVACRCRPPDAQVSPIGIESKELSQQMLRIDLLQAQLEQCRATLASLRSQRDAQQAHQKCAEVHVESEITSLLQREGELLRRLEEASIAATCIVSSGSSISATRTN